MTRQNLHPSFAIAEADVPFLAQIPANFARPIKLLHYEKMNYVEIATDLGLPIGTVKSRIHRGREIIRRLRDEEAARTETWQESRI